jgi:cytochrome c5
MANYDQGNSGSTIWQVVLVIVGSIIGFTLLVALIAYLFSGGGADTSAEAVAEDRTQVEENIAPLASVEVASADAVGEKAEKTGEEIVNGSCAMCHGTGMMESPKLGDAGQWEPRIAQGYDTLVNNAINGIRNMPAKGGNAALTDKEVARAVAYMANQAGADFTAE